MRTLLTLYALASAANAYSRRRCTLGDTCWPDDSTWQAFNHSVSGRLIQSVPSAAVCHDARYDPGLCSTARTEWTNSFWRTNQTGAYSAILWELGNDQCFINSPPDTPCDPGLVPHYSVAVQDVEDIQKAVKFAYEKDLYLVVKNTGHSHLGRSSGRGSFSIWTHNLKGKEWHQSFVAKGARKGTQGVPAVTLQAGEQWLDVYKAAAEQNVIVVGGHARTVGSAGGYLTGGGHSAFAYSYGLAVDNLLEVTLVTASGDHNTINAYTDPDYFYAIRGGGGSAWGVITSVTYKTHPNPSHIQVGLAQINTTDQATFRTVLHGALQALPSITDAGYTGYGVMSSGSLGLIFIQTNGVEDIFNTTFAPIYKLAALPNVTGQAGSINFPTWIDYCNAFLQDPNIATNIIDTTRLLTADVLLKRTEDLVNLIAEFDGLDGFSAGFNFIGKVSPTERDRTAVHPIWKNSRALLSFGTDWADDAPAEEKSRKKKRSVEVSERLGKIVGPNGGTYVNEANPYEPDWQNIFWGSKYNRLLAIKKRIDPTNLFICNRCVGTDIIFEP